MTVSRLPLTLDWIVHQPARLGLMTMLGHQPCSYTTIRKELAMNGGLVTRHTHYLELIGYVSRHVEATTGRIHRSTFALTADGRKALAEYYSTLAKIVHNAPAGYNQ